MKHMFYHYERREEYQGVINNIINGAKEEVIILFCPFLTFYANKVYN